MAKKESSQQNITIKTSFTEVFSIIEHNRVRALQEVNNNTLLTAWCVGAYISGKIKSSEWGSKVVTELSEYLRAKDPSLKGYSRRNLYMMVRFYEVYSSESFVSMLKRFNLQIPFLLENDSSQIVQFEIAQFPQVLLSINWTCHQQILNMCKMDEQRLFYMVLAKREQYQVKELQRAIKTNAFESILGNRDFMTPTLKKVYPASSSMFRDVAYLDFLGLPQKYEESKLRKGIVEHMKQFILELGKDFIFMDEEYKIDVGGKTFSIDLLFFHRALQCLVAVELKTEEFEPSFMGQLEFYLEALDQNEKRGNENPSIGILLCKESNHEVVKYALNRSMSPAMVAEYKEKMIPQDVLQRSMDGFLL